MNGGDEWLAAVAQKMRDAQANGLALTPELLTVRELLNRYGFTRRGDWINTRIRNKLEELQLLTSPDFASAWFRGTISITLIPEATDTASRYKGPDPTLRIRALDAAHNKPKSVKPDQHLVAATTVMQLYNFSQMPVMTSQRDVKGIVSWSLSARGWRWGVIPHSSVTAWNRHMR